MELQHRRYVPSGFVMAHLVNPIVQRLGGTLVLVVPGRQSGQPRTVPLGRPLRSDSMASGTWWGAVARRSGCGTCAPRAGGAQTPRHHNAVPGG